MPWAADHLSLDVWLALQLGGSEAGEAGEHGPLQPGLFKAQPADESLHTTAMLATRPSSAHTQLQPVEAPPSLATLHSQAQTGVGGEVQPAFIHQSVLQRARGQELPANTALYGLFRLQQPEGLLMVYGTNLADIQLVTALHPMP